MKQLYAEFEPFTLAAAEAKKATCKEGCAHCCYKFTTISLPEGIAIAEYLLTELSMGWNFQALMKKVYETAKAVASPDLNETKYFEKQIPCPFLDSGSRCRIYDVRPAVCRYHYVVSPPENCAFEAPNPSVLFLNLRRLEQKIWNEGNRVSKQVGLPESVFAPLPVTVSWGMRALTEGLDTWLDGMEKLGTAFTLDYWLGRMTLLAIEAGAFDLKCTSCGHVQSLMGKPNFDERPRCPNCEDGYLDLVQSAAAAKAIEAETAR
jgi:Fe-S-cluster containining protein